MTDEQSGQTATREHVRERYAAAAIKVRDGKTSGGCCGPAPTASCCDPAAAEAGDGFGSTLYTASERAELPDTAVEASLGCGNPLMVADLHPGEIVLDLGSGGGIDVLLSARRVGPSGKAFGLDMTDEMLDLARHNAHEAGATNVEFLRGHIEDIPLPTGSVDVVISNCVINLSTDKPAVFASTFRVLRPGGRLGVTDVVAENHLSPDERAERGAWVGCVAGALSIAEYEQGLTDAGFTDVEITPTHAVADGMHSAIIRARKPDAQARRLLPAANIGGRHVPEC
jgi:arsenite methyltransferase